jgi:hypothetical protein
MASGLQVWDASARITFDTNYSTSRVLGVVSQVGVYARRGSVADGRFSTGRQFFMFSPKSVGNSSYGFPYIASVGIRIEGNTLYWDVYFSGDNYNADCGTIIYGVY